jgi:malonyl-CoA/methylmalonyl-CoA synthetase
VLTAQAQSLQQAWEYSPSDHLLHVLPLHHIHGTVNALLTPLLCGSTIEFLFPFNPSAVWSRLAAPFLAQKDSATTSATPKKGITFFTVVPTVYSRLLASHKELSPELQDATRTAISPDRMRLSISGSAALPTPVKEAWKTLSKGNVLLERYGMTEVGMALSCGLEFPDRVDASVGWPLPSVEARLVDTDTNEVIAEADTDRAGEIHLRGPTVFKEYWRNPSATAAEFVNADAADSNQRPWFKTGDVALRRNVPSAGGSEAPSQSSWTKGPMFFIQGRKSADIIKTGGEKVSALEVERELLSLPQVVEAAVVAVPSGKWGHKVGAIIILDQEWFQKENKAVKWSPMDMRRALKSSLAAYKIPQVLKLVDHIPRNAMGKINKKELVKNVFAEEHSADEL